MTTLRRIAFFIALLAPLAAAAAYSLQHAARAVIAARLMPPVAISQDRSPASVTLAKRMVQRHFLSWEVYIPVEDIFIASPEPEGVDPAVREFAAQGCRSNQAAAWVPLRFILPIYGEHVVEWCIRPRLQRTSG